MNFWVCDCETVPDDALYTAPVLPPGQPAPFPPLYAHRPIVVGALALDEHLRCERLVVIDHRDEKLLLEAWLAMARERPLVTYNGSGFDLPVLRLRSLRYGLPWTQPRHLDLHEMLSQSGRLRGLSLDGIARLCGLPGKLDFDGSQVEAAYRAGELARIAAYCLSDVVQTALVFLRMQLSDGAIGRQDYQAATDSLLEAVAGDPRLATLAARLDRTKAPSQ